MFLPDSGKSLKQVYVRLDTIPECDGQTDGQICQDNNGLCVHSMLTRDKNGLC